MKVKDGVSWFAVYAADPEKMKIFFPNGKVCCTNCKHLYSDSLNRTRCRVTGEIIFEPDYPALPEICPYAPTGEIVGHKYKEE